MRLSHALRKTRASSKRPQAPESQGGPRRQGHRVPQRLRGRLHGLCGPVDGNCCLQAFVPGKAHLSECEEASAIKQAGRTSALVLGGVWGDRPPWLLTGHFSSSFMITKDNQGSWKPAIFVPFTLFGPQAPKTLSQCPRGPLPFRENA